MSVVDNFALPHAVASALATVAAIGTCRKVLLTSSCWSPCGSCCGCRASVRSVCCLGRSEPPRKCSAEKRQSGGTSGDDNGELDGLSRLSELGCGWLFFMARVVVRHTVSSLLSLCLGSGAPWMTTKSLCCSSTERRWSHLVLTSESCADAVEGHG